MIRYFLFVLIGLCTPFLLLAQSCCSGGVPVSSNLGLPASEKGSLQISLAYDWNVLNTFQEGTERISDQSRKRSTHSTLLELGYSWTNRFSTDLFLAYIYQVRNINQNGQQTDFDQAGGIGDAVALLKYQLWNRRQGATTLQIGLGPKLPLGAFNRTDERGITLSADLQPGSGAWDILFWGLLTQQLSFRPTMTLTVASTYARKGENKVFNKIETYAFGDEWISSLGISDRIFFAQQLFDPSLQLRYRHAAPDFRNASRLPSTGGHWLFLNPGITLWLQPQISLQVNAEIPIYADVEGTQTTPTYRFNTGAYWRF